MKRILKKIAMIFSSLFEKDIFNTIISIVAAVLIWFTVSVSVYPTITRAIYNVPVEVDMTGTHAEANNYQVMNISANSVTVYITGNRGQIGNLSADDLTAVVNADNVFTPSTYTLPINIVCKTGKEFEVTRIALDNNTIENVSVEFDEIITKDIQLVPLMKSSDVKIAPGYICDTDDVVVTPSVISVTGPKETVGKITEAYVRIKSDTELLSTLDYVASSSDIELFSDTEEMTAEYSNLSLSKTSFNVHIPILKKQTVTLGVRIINAPDSFNSDAFMEQLDFSAAELDIAALSEKIKDIESIDIGAIDMREVDIGSVFTFNTEDFLPEGYQNLSEINTITITCPSVGLEKMPIHITQSALQIINAPAQFNYKIISSGFNLFFIGPKDIMDQLTYIDINAQIDLSNNVDMTAGDYKFPVIFDIPAYDGVWCIGTADSLSPKATVTVTEKTN